MVFLDLDDFKDVSGSLGHSAGDEVLIAVADRLRTHVRPSDTVARFGGDEFAILLEAIPHAAGLTDLADRILDALQEPFDVADTTVQLGVSAGVAYRNPRHEPEQLLRNADVAMYATKARGGGRMVFEQAMHEELLARLRLETDLRTAVEREEFVMWCQPVTHH